EPSHEAARAAVVDLGHSAAEIAVAVFVMDFNRQVIGAVVSGMEFGWAGRLDVERGCVAASAGRREDHACCEGQRRCRSHGATSTRFCSNEKVSMPPCASAESM